MSLLDYLFSGGSSAPTSGLLASDPTAAATALHNEMRNQQLAGMAAGLLQASGPSFTPHSLGQDIGAGIIGGVQGRQNALRQAVAQQQLQGLTLQNQGTQNLLNYRQQMLQELNADPSSPAAARASTMTGSPGAAPPGGLLAPDTNSAQPAIFQTPGGDASMPGAGAPAGAVPPGQPNIGGGAPGGSPAAPVPYAPKLAQTQNGPSPLIDPTMALRNARLALANGDDKSAAVWLSQVKPPDGYRYLSNGALGAIPNGPADPATHLALGTADTLGKNLQTIGPNGAVTALPGSQETAARGAGMTSGAQAAAAYPYDIGKIGAQGAQTQANSRFDASITPDTMTVPAVDSSGKPVVDSNGQPIMQSMQTTKLARVQAGNVPGLPVLSPQQKAAQDVWEKRQNPLMTRNEQASINIPGAGELNPTLPAGPSDIAPLSSPAAVPGAAPGGVGAAVVKGKSQAQIDNEVANQKDMHDTVTNSVNATTDIANFKLMQRALDEVKNGPTAAIRTQGAAHLDEIFGAGTGKKLLGIDPAAANEFNKVATQLALKQQRAQGAGEAASIYQAAKQAFPSIEMSNMAPQDLLGLLIQDRTRQQDKAQFVQDYYGTGSGRPDFGKGNANTEFDKVRPPEIYTSRVKPVDAPNTVKDLRPGVTYVNPKGGTAVWTGMQFVPAVRDPNTRAWTPDSPAQQTSAPAAPAAPPAATPAPLPQAQQRRNPTVPMIYDPMTKKFIPRPDNVPFGGGFQ